MMSTLIATAIAEAREAALAAFNGAKPVPMIVGQARGFSNEIIPGTEEFVADGVCGFAWINIKPARGEFVKYLKVNGIGDRGTYGGWTISSYEATPGTGYSQSMQRKEAGCRAFVAKIKEYFPDMKIWVESRLD